VLHFPGEEKSADFEKAIQRKLENKDFNFRGVWFPDDVSFATFRIETRADFSRAYFAGRADFVAAEFNEEAIFVSARFAQQTFFLAPRSETQRILNTLFLTKSILALSLFVAMPTSRSALLRSSQFSC